MQKQSSDSKKRPNGNNRAFKMFIFISVVLMVAGLCFLAVEPIKSLRREQIMGDAMDVMVSKMSEAVAASPSDGEPEKEIEETFIVPRDGNEAAGEEYDYFGDNESDVEDVKKFIAARKAKLPKNVTLSCIGVLEMKTINKRLPVWNSTSSVALRYGVGLYEDSVRPGQNGNAAILGHNMKNTTLFSKLYKLKVGDNVRFIKLNGHYQDYRIDKIEIVYKTKLGNYVDGEASDTPQLTLVTCANDTGEGNRRVIICHPVK
jgi:LPXTG-site transpeptidase (sortase) family protein